MKELTVKTMKDNGNLINEDMMFVRESDILIIEVKTGNSGGMMVSSRELDRVRTSLKQLLSQDSGETKTLILPDSIKLKVLSVKKD